MTVVWTLSWLMRRCRRVLPIALTVLGLYFVSIYLFPAQKSDSYREVSVTSVTTLTTSLPPPATSIAKRWLIVNNSDIGLCSRIAPEFSHWNLLFVTTSSLPTYVNTSQCHSLSGMKEKGVMLKEAYLHAIGQGADIIYIVHRVDDLKNLRLLSHLPLDKEYLWTLASFSPNSTLQFNAAEHFGCLSSTNSTSQNYRHCKVSPGIIAPMMLQVSKNLPKKFRCDETSPLLSLSSGSYADFCLAEAVFMRSTFWALPLFSNATVKYGTEWSYIVQWLLWQTGQGLTVYLPSNYHHYVNTLSSPSKVINLLSKTDCTAAIDNCIISLLKRLLSLHLVSDKFVEDVTDWVQDLKKAGYVFPTVKAQMNSLNCSSAATWSPVLASGVPDKKFIAVANVAHSSVLQNRLCRALPTKINVTDFGAAVNLTHPWHQFRRLLLVVIFNKPHYEVIPHLELLYRSIFPHILYCGPTALNQTGIPSLSGYRISFITYTEWPVHRAPGSVNYQCAIQAVRMNFAVDGFLFASDDLLLLPVPLSKLSRSRVWFVPANEIRIGDLDTLRECRLGMCDFHPHWDWWADYKTATIEALDKMAQLAKLSPLFYRCISTLRQQNGVGQSQIRVNGAYSDIFYIPSRIAHDFADVTEVFADVGVFLEIAVPTALKCIEPIKNFQSLPGKDIQLSVKSRSEPWKFFNKGYLFAQSYLHPVKWSPLVNRSKQHIQLLCSKVLPYIHDPFSRLH